MLDAGLSEETDQILFVNWVHREYPHIWPWLHHSPNGKRRTKAEGAKLKLMGVRAGFPDLYLAWPLGEYRGLVIEMKLGKGKATPAQKEWLAHFKKCGYVAEVLTLDAAQKTFTDYMECKI